MADKTRVGLTYVDGIASGPRGGQAVHFLIDTGAQISLLPDEVWRAIGLSEARRLTFTLADGTRVSRGISECVIELPSLDLDLPRLHSPVILGEPRDVALLGVLTLETYALVFNPFDRSLKPMAVLPLMRFAA